MTGQEPKGKYSFMGWWSSDEKTDSPEPWERFTVILNGTEAGDYALEESEVDEILSASGYEIVIRKKTVTGQELQDRITALGFNQSSFARAIGVSSRSVSSMERPVSNPIPKLVDVLLEIMEKYPPRAFSYLTGEDAASYSDTQGGGVMKSYKMCATALVTVLLAASSMASGDEGTDRLMDAISRVGKEACRASPLYFRRFSE